MERHHPQDHFRQIRALNFGLTKLRALVEFLLAIKPDANAIGHAPGAAFALMGATLGNRLDWQSPRSCSRTVTAYPRKPRIDDIANAWNGYRRLRDIRGDHDFPAVARREHSLL